MSNFKIPRRPGSVHASPLGAVYEPILSLFQLLASVTSLEVLRFFVAHHALDGGPGLWALGGRFRRDSRDSLELRGLPSRCYRDTRSHLAGVDAHVLELRAYHEEPPSAGRLYRNS